MVVVGGAGQLHLQKGLNNMKDKYSISKLSPDKGSRWILYCNGEYVMDYATRKDARLGRKAWKDLMDFSNVPPMPSTFTVTIYKENEIYP